MAEENHQILYLLRRLTRYSIQSKWRFYLEDLPPDKVDPDNWPQVSLNDKGYITWAKGGQVLWLAQKVIIPSELNHYSLAGCSLRIALTWWASWAQIYVNGDLLQEGDLFDCSVRLLVAKSVILSEQILLAIRLISPNHDDGALTHSECIYEKDGDPGFIADELTVLSKYLTTFAPEKLEAFERLIAQINWDLVSDSQAFDLSLANLRAHLEPLAVGIKDRCFHVLGHAHLDMAWLWTLEETWKAAEKTFTSVLSLQQDFPELIFCHTTSALYAWIETHLPNLFNAIATAVAEGKWELVGGMWVESDANLLGGESFVRQLIYGQYYLQAKFNTITPVAWLPDTFGFCWQLPQIFSQAGIKYFVTSKLHWNDTNKFPYGSFLWRSPDGTSLLTLICSPLGMDTNPIKMTDYALTWETQTGLQDIFWLPGVGDHGGGPSRDMLDVARLWQKSPFFPEIKYTKAVEYLDLLPAATLPVWDDELYLEFHRGCYTTHADQKRNNRHTEHLLYQAELFFSVAVLAGAVKDTSVIQSLKAKLEKAWKITLFNQFHDIIPGTSIKEVFIEANQQWDEAIATTAEVLKTSLGALTKVIDYGVSPHPEAKPLVIFNSLNWKRSEVVAVKTNKHKSKCCVYNAQGEKIPTQLTSNQEILFVADIPSVGYGVYWLAFDEEHRDDLNLVPEEFKLENEQLLVKIDSTTGELGSIFDKEYNREILKGKGNQLQAFQDQGQYWDAWNIDPNYHKHLLPPAELKSIEWQETGPLRWCVRVVKQLGISEFIQEYSLAINSRLLKIKTVVNWQENKVLLKVAFPLNLESDYVTYEIACGAIKRSTRGETEADRAKWEVPGLNWADLTDFQANYGVSLLNDCKYGYDAQTNQLRLSLLRSSNWPDPEADRGFHEFTYGLYPHPGDWKSSKTVHKGYELNMPLLVFPADEGKATLLSRLGQFLTLGADNLILMALKPGEQEGWFLRFYEAHGEEGELRLGGDLALALDHSVDLLERDLHQNSSGAIYPWKITTFKLKA